MQGTPDVAADVLPCLDRGLASEDPRFGRRQALDLLATAVPLVLALLFGVLLLDPLRSEVVEEGIRQNGRRALVAALQEAEDVKFRKYVVRVCTCVGEDCRVQAIAYAISAGSLQKRRFVLPGSDEATLPRSYV